MRNDPVADMLTRIRNGSRARLERVEMPFSDLKVRIAEILKSEGFISDFRSISGKVAGQGVIEVKLKYDEERSPVITGLKRISKCGARTYMGCDDIPKVQSGLGIVILTTPKGLMTDRQARKQRIGGEALCAVW
jgi:small subunit ribosomal protein S8